jgi:hypothetical protein
MTRAGARTWAVYMASGCLAALCVAAYVWRMSLRQPVFEFYVFDTPGAPSLFVRTADDRRILVNGGSNSDIVTRMTRLLPFYSRRIDEIVATDDDPKHIVGLIEALQRYDVGSVVVGNATSSDSTYSVFLRLLTEKKMKPSIFTKGDLIQADGLSLKLIDRRRAIFTLSAASAAGSSAETVLIFPFNPELLSKKIITATRPEYLIYSASLKAKPKPDALAGIMEDHRFNVRETGTVRASIKKAPSPTGDGAQLNIERY